MVRMGTLHRLIAVAGVIALTVGLGGCLDMIYGWHYDQTKAGELKGTLRIDPPHLTSDMAERAQLICLRSC